MRDVAHAAIDISDGLVADLGRGVDRLRIVLPHAPAHAALAREGHRLDRQEVRRPGEPGLDEARIEMPARTEDEPRFLVIGKIGGTPWSAVITYGGEQIRIISVRRSRQEEVEHYVSE